jgi:hypothetical protein
LEKVKAAKKKVMQIGSTSIIPLNKNASNFHGKKLISNFLFFLKIFMKIKPFLKI